jgi:hypothetical protein
VIVLADFGSKLGMARLGFFLCHARIVPAPRPLGQNFFALHVPLIWGALECRRNDWKTQSLGFKRKT